MHAAAAVLGRAPAALDRANSYIAVMLDDLTLHGVSEPYRMLTARAEYRLRLRANNAATRLTPLAIAAGCVGAERAAWFAKRELERAKLLTGQTTTDGFGWAEELEEDARYAPYLARQDAELRDLRAGEALPLDDRLDYSTLAGLSREMAERLGAARPATLGAAGRVAGVTPAALAVLLVHARQRLVA